MKYGELPVDLGQQKITVEEMMFYQYLPLKLSGDVKVIGENRLSIFQNVIQKVVDDYVDEFGLQMYTDSYIYLTAKNLFVKPGNGLNRPGWHSDGYLTDDINYIWSDKYPTVFNNSHFELSNNHEESLRQMEIQAYDWNNITYQSGSLLRLNQYNIHKCADITEPGMRAFVKISFSKDKYNLAGNSHNYELKYQWDMKPRGEKRNHPIA